MNETNSGKISYSGMSFSDYLKTNGNQNTNGTLTSGSSSRKSYSGISFSDYLKKQEQARNITNDDALLFNNTFGAESITEDQRNNFGATQEKIEANGITEAEDNLGIPTVNHKGNNYFFNGTIYATEELANTARENYIKRNNLQEEDNATKQASVPSITQTDNGYVFNGTTYASQSLAQQAQDQWKADNNVTDEPVLTDEEKQIEANGGLTDEEQKLFNSLTLEMYSYNDPATPQILTEKTFISYLSPEKQELYKALKDKQVAYQAEKEVIKLDSTINEETGMTARESKVYINNYESNLKQIQIDAIGESDYERYLSLMERIRQSSKAGSMSGIVVSPLTAEEYAFIDECQKRASEAQDKYIAAHQSEIDTYEQSKEYWNSVKRRFNWSDEMEEYCSDIISEQEELKKEEYHQFAVENDISDEEAASVIENGEYLSEDYVKATKALDSFDDETNKAFEDQNTKMSQSMDEYDYYDSQISDLLGVGWQNMEAEDIIYAMKGMTSDQIEALQVYYFLYRESAGIINEGMNISYGDMTYGDIINGLNNPYDKKYANSADTLANISDINAEISKYDIATFDMDRIDEFIRHSMESGVQSLVGGTIDTVELIKEYRAGKEVTVYDELGNAVVTYTRDEYDPDNYWRQLGDELLEKSQKNLEKAKSNRGVVGGLFADALKSNVEMLPDLALMMATGGASKFATIALTTASIAMRTLGAEDYALRQEYGDKISVSDRLLIAGLNTGVEALTEAVFEIIPGKAAGYIDPQKLVAGAALQVSNPFVAGSLLMAGSMAGEATEELIGGILSPIVEAIKLSQVEGKNGWEELSNIYSSPEHWAEVGRSMLVAALAVGIMPSTHHEAGKTTKARNYTAASAESGFSTLKSNNISAENFREMLIDPNNNPQKAAEKIRNGRSDEEISEKELELIKRLESAEPITEEVANTIVDGYREYLKTDKTASAILRMCSKLYGGDFKIAADALLVQDIAIANNPSINSMTDIGTRVTEDASVNEHYGVSKDGAAVDPNAKRAPAMRPAEQALASEAQAQAEISQAETAPAITEDQAQAEYAQVEDIQTETTPVENRELIDTANSIAERAPTETEAQAEIASIEEVNPDADLGIDNKNDVEENAKVHKMTQEEFNYIQKNDAETFEIISKIQDSAKNDESIKLNSETKEKLANVGIEVVLGLGKSRVEFNVKNNSKLANVNARTDVKVQEQSKADNNLGITRNVAETATVSTKANTNTEILARGLTYEADTIASMNAVENKTATVEQARDAIAAADRAIRLSNFELSTASIDISNMSNAEISARQQHIDELNNIISSAEAIKAQAEQIIKESEEKQNDLRNSEGQNGETGNAESRESAEAGQNAETVEQREWSEKEYQSKKKEIRNIELALKQFFGKKNSEVRAKYEKAFVKAIYDITKGDVKNLRIVNKAPGDVIGVYDNNTDITHISLNKNQTAGEFLRTLAHEQTHKDISHLSPEEYSRVLNDVRKALVDLGPDIDDVILTLTEGYFRRYGTTSAKMKEDIYLDTEIKNEEGLAWIYEEILTHSVEYQFPEDICFEIIDSIKGNIRNEIIANMNNEISSMMNVGDKRFRNVKIPKISSAKGNTNLNNNLNQLLNKASGTKAKLDVLRENINYSKGASYVKFLVWAGYKFEEILNSLMGVSPELASKTQDVINYVLDGSGIKVIHRKLGSEVYSEYSKKYDTVFINDGTFDGKSVKDIARYRLMSDYYKLSKSDKIKFLNGVLHSISESGHKISKIRSLINNSEVLNKYTKDGHIRKDVEEHEITDRELKKIGQAQNKELYNFLVDVKNGVLKISKDDLYRDVSEDVQPLIYNVDERIFKYNSIAEAKENLFKNGTLKIVDGKTVDLNRIGIYITSDGKIMVKKGSNKAINETTISQYLDSLFAGEINIDIDSYEEDILLALASNAMVGNLTSDNIKLGNIIYRGIENEKLKDIFLKNAYLINDEKNFFSELSEKDLKLSVKDTKRLSELYQGSLDELNRRFVERLEKNYGLDEELLETAPEEELMFDDSDNENQGESEYIEEISEDYEEDSDKEDFDEKDSNKEYSNKEDFYNKNFGKYYDSVYENERKSYLDYYDDYEDDYSFGNSKSRNSNKNAEIEYGQGIGIDDATDPKYLYYINKILPEEGVPPEVRKITGYRNNEQISRQVIGKVDKNIKSINKIVKYLGNKAMNTAKNIQNIIYSSGAIVLCDKSGKVIEITQNKTNRKSNGDFDLTYDVSVYKENGTEIKIDDRALRSLAKSSKTYVGDFLQHGTLQLAAKLRAAEKIMNVNDIYQAVGPEFSNETLNQVINSSENFNNVKEENDSIDTFGAYLSTMKCKIDRDTYEREAKNEIAESFADEESDYFDLPEIFSEEFNSPNIIYNAIPVEVTSENKDTVVAHDNVDNKDVTAFDVAVKSDEILGEALAANEEYKKALDTDILESYKIGNELIFDYFSNRGINAKDIAGIVNYASKNFADINSVATEENQVSAEKKNMLDERYAGESKPVIFNLRAGEHRLVSEADCISSSIYSENGNLFHSAEDIRDCNIEDASGTYINGADSMSHHVIKQGEAVGKVDAELHRTDSSRKGRGWMKCLEKYRSFMANEVRSKAEAYDKSGSMKDYEALLNVLDEANSMYIQEHYENSRCKFFIDGFAMDNVGKPLGKVLQFLTSIQPDTRTLGIIDMLDGYNNGAHVKLLQQIYYASQLRVMEVLSHKEPVMRNAQELMDDFGFTDHEIQLFLDTQNLLGNKRFGEWREDGNSLSYEELTDEQKEQFSNSLWNKKRFIVEMAEQKESIVDKKESTKIEFKNSKFNEIMKNADLSTPQGRYDFFIDYDRVFRYLVNEKASELNKSYQAMIFDEEEGYYLTDVGYEEKFLDSYREYMNYLHNRYNEEAALTIGKQQGTGRSSFYTKMYWNHEDILNSKKNRNYTGGLSSRNLVMMRPLRENRGNSAETYGDRVDTLTVPSFTYTINEYSSYMAEAIGEGQFYQLFKSFQDNADNPYWKTLEGKIGKKNVEKIKNTFEYMSGVLEKESPNLLDRIFNTWQAGVLGGNLAAKGHKTGKLAYTTWMAQTFSTDTAEQIIGKAAIGRVEDTVTSYGSRLSRADVQKMVDNIKYSSLKALAQARLDGNMYEDFSMGSHDNLISLKDAATCALIMQEVCNRYSETEAGLKAVEAMDTQPNYDRISNGYYGYKRQSSPAWKLMLLFRNQRSTNMTRLLSAAAKYDVNKSQENLDNLVSTVKGVSHSTLKIALAKAIVNTLLRGWWTDGDDDDKKGEIEDFALFFAKNLLAQITAGIAGNGFWLNEAYNVCIFLLSGGFKNYYSKSEFNKDISDIFGGYASGMFPGFMSTAFNVATSAYNVIASMGNDKEFDFYNANNLACNVLQLFGVPASQLERVFMGALGASTTAYSLLGGNLPDSLKTNSFYKFAKALCTPNADTSELNMFIDSTSDSKSNAWDLLSSREQRKLTKDGFGKASYNIWAECNMEDVMSEEVYLNFVDSADVNGNGVVSKDEAEAFVLNNPEYEYVAGDYFKAKTAKHTSEGFVTSSGYTSKQEEYAERYNIPLEVFDKYDTDHNGEFSSEEKNAMPYDIQKAIGRSNISAANPETGMTDSEYAKWQKKGETWGLTTDAYIRIKALDKNGGGVSQDEMMQGIANGDVTVAEAWQYGLANGWSTKNMTKKFGKMPEGVSTTEQQRTISAVKPVELPNFNYNVDDLLIP